MSPSPTRSLGPVEGPRRERTPLSDRLPAPVAHALRLVRVDFPSEPASPRPGRLAFATVISLVGSLGADALLVVLGTHVFPSTTGYTHFRFSDYGKLTAIGVVIACAAWPVVTQSVVGGPVAVSSPRHRGHPRPMASRPVDPVAGPAG